MSVKDTALEYHLNGYNCAQSVLAACRDYYDIDEKRRLPFPQALAAVSAAERYAERYPAQLWRQVLPVRLMTHRIPRQKEDSDYCKQKR